jgi:peptide/nickel transport system substrate-binding protein
MRSRACAYWILSLTVALLLTTGCDRSRNPTTVVMVIENSPTNLDPRIGTDGVSEHIDALIFDALVRRDEHFEIQPELAQSWETPDPLTYIFHLRSGVRFHDGSLLTSKDVQWTLTSILSGKLVTVKAQAYRNITAVESPDPLTVVIHLKQPDPGLLVNLTDGAIGIVPNGSGRDFGRHPVGSGPFRFVSQETDKEVVVERNPDYWQTPPSIPRVRFSVVPDQITRALELQKGSADVGVSSLSPDQLYALRNNQNLVIESGPGTVLNYISFNTRDPQLRDVHVRQAIALAIDRPLIIRTLLRGHAQLAESLLPSNHWAWTGDVQTYPFDPAKANILLDAAGYRRGADGIRFHLTIKTSTDETARTLAVVMQQQLRNIGIALDVRTFEFATFYADITKGAFQLYTLRWIGGNEDPDIFRYAYATASQPPHGANRGYYSNPRLDALIAQAAVTSDQSQRAAIYRQIQQIVATDLPAINLWYLDTVVVHNRRLSGLRLSSSGNFDFLRYATVKP